MARRKSEALQVPRDQGEATALIAHYIAGERALMLDKLRTQQEIDRAKAALGERVADRELSQSARFAAIKAWWEAGGDKLAGARRSADVAGAKLGLRKTPPALKLAKGVKPEAIIGWMRSLRDKGTMLRRFTRQSAPKLDREAIVKALGNRKGNGAAIAEKLEAQGLSTEQRDEFFIDTGLDEDAIRKELAGG